MAVAPLSIVGSLLVLCSIVRLPKKKRWNRVYNRLMTLISTFDLMLSGAYTVGPLAIPSELTLLNPLARGTTQGCTAQGFFKQLGLISLAYSAGLVLYFVLAIRFGVKEDRIAKYYEPWMHLIILVLFGGIAIAGLGMQIYNPVVTGCFIAAYPPFCDVQGGTDSCTRGKYAEQYLLYASTIPAFVLLFILLLGLLIIVITVIGRRRASRRRFEKHVAHWQNESASQAIGSEDVSSSEVGRGSRLPRRRSRSASTKSSNTNINLASTLERQVVTQSLLYALNFVNSIIWATTASILRLVDDHNAGETNLLSNFWTYIMAVTFLPLVGFFNFFIFIRTRYQAIRMVAMDKSRFFAFYNAVWNPDIHVSLRASNQARLIAANNPIREAQREEQVETSNEQDVVSSIEMSAFSATKSSTGQGSQQFQASLPPTKEINGEGNEDDVTDT